MESIAARLTRLLIAKNGGNRSEMARVVRVSPQAVQKWLAGESEPRGKNLDAAADFLGVSAQELKFGQGPGTVQDQRGAAEPVRPAAVITVPAHRFAVSPAGDAWSCEVEDCDEPAPYFPEWFAKNRIDPQNARRIRVPGENMKPMLYPGDFILVDLADTQICDGRLYALRYGSRLRVCYLSQNLDGTLVLRSANAAYKDEEISPALAQGQLTVIGRVRDCSGPGGL